MKRCHREHGFDPVGGLFKFYVNFRPNYAFLHILYKYSQRHSSSTISGKKRKNFIFCNGIRTAATSKPGRSELRVNFLPAAEVPAIQVNSRSLALPPIRKCICGIHRIRGKMGFSVWTVQVVHV